MKLNLVLVNNIKKNVMKNRLLIMACFMLLPVAVVSAQDESENVITFDVGDFEMTLFSEGQQQGRTGILVGATPEILEKTAPEGIFPNAVNTFFLKTKDKNILIDTGFGRNLFKFMESREVKPESIDVVLITHMHGDHTGGLVKDGKPMFPNAKLYISRPEYDYWMSSSTGNSQQQKDIIEIYRNKLEVFVPGELDNKAGELFPGIRAIFTPGHTPGHTVYLVKSNKSQVLVWGDITHANQVQMPYPDVAVTYDVNPVMAVETRKKVLSYVSKNNISVAGMHIAFPGIGRISALGDGYEFAEWCPCEGR